MVGVLVDLRIFDEVVIVRLGKTMRSSFALHFVCAFLSTVLTLIGVVGLDAMFSHRQLHARSVRIPNFWSHYFSSTP